jgi:uncharacterized protein (TIGR02611 family)
VSDREFLGSRPGPDPEDIPDLIRKLRERKARHKQRNIVHRAGVVVLGVFLVIAGVVMSGPGVPGPGIATILLGLFFLALEFERAERLLVRAIHWGEHAAQRAERSSTAERVAAAGAGLLALAAIVIAAVLWDIPLVPLL